jgi:hypothetical protein
MIKSSNLLIFLEKINFLNYFSIYYFINLFYHFNLLSFILFIFQYIFLI